MKRAAHAADVDMTPMLDVSLILLIFFIVTASLMKESGVEVARPRAAAAAVRHEIAIAVSSAGAVRIGPREVALDAVRRQVAAARKGAPGSAVRIVADPAAPPAVVVAVMDQARAAGAIDISISARTPTR